MGGAILIGVLIFLSLNKWKNDPLRVIWSDAEGYYMYLPGTFLYQFEDMPLRTPGWPKRGDKTFTKYSCGVAILQAPFFAAAHLYAMMSSDEANGFSFPYGLAIIISAIFYALLGLLLLYKTLRRHYSPGPLIVSILLLGLGSNLYYYTIAESGMSHIYSFFLFCVIIFLTPYLYKNSNLKTFILIGFVCGLTILVRPTNLIIGLWILFYNIDSIEALKGRINFFRGKMIYMVGAAAALALPWLPQILYWKYATGDWVAYSYGDEGFDFWNNPKMLQVLTHLENGLFLYSPLILIPVIGVLYGLEAKVKNSWLILVLFITATYIFGSWWDWNFGGAFGHRCYVEFYALLLGPLVWVVSEIGRSRFLISKIVFGLLSSLLVYYSLQMTYAYAPPWDGPDWTWYRLVDIIRSFF